MHRRDGVSGTLTCVVSPRGLLVDARVAVRLPLGIEEFVLLVCDKPAPGAFIRALLVPFPVQSGSSYSEDEQAVRLKTRDGRAVVG
jgi:hypothetical protein